MQTLNNNIKKSNGRLIDETGNKYHMLTVVGYAGSGKKFKSGFDGGAAWRCRCDCGNETIVLGTRLRKGINKSCGCSQVLPEGEGSFNAMYRVRVVAARNRGIKWDLSKDEVMEISKQPCFYCGLPPSNVGRGSTNGNYIYSGIDRVDSNGAYEPNNIVPCCEDCNKAKLTKTIPEFLEWFKKIIIHNEWGFDVNTIKFKKY